MDLLISYSVSSAANVIHLVQHSVCLWNNSWNEDARMEPWIAGDFIIELTSVCYLCHHWDSLQNGDMSLKWSHLML